MKPIVKAGDKVQFWRNTLDPEYGTVINSEIRYGATYAVIKPDTSEDFVYLFHGAVWGFEPINVCVHPWSPQSMGRLKTMRVGRVIRN